MPFTFPASLDDFVAALPIRDCTVELPETVAVSRTEGGELITDNIGNRLFQGTVTLGRLTPYEADDAQSLIDVMRGAEASFMINDRLRRGPREDPDGSGLVGRDVTFRSLRGSDARQMALNGLPPFYQLRRGDYLSFEYQSNPSRFAFHRLAEDIRAFSGGSTDWFQVMPPVRPGVAVGAPVRLVDPMMKARIIPGSVKAGRKTRFVTDGISFQFMQTLR